jgi:disulfide bond formation protein DsbB
MERTTVTAAMYLLHPVRWIVVALASALGLLAAAHAFETFGGLAPCELCLTQRGVYWLAAAVAAAGLVFLRFQAPEPVARLVCLALALVFAGEVWVAAYHAGVEWTLWPGPAACTGGKTHVTLDQLKAFAQGRHVSIVRCDQPAFRFLSLSMAGWNALIALKLTVLSVVSARRPL